MIYRKKFVKEAKNLAQMNHPHIVKVADMFGGSIHVGMRIGLLFPITLCFMLFLFNIMNHNANKQK